MSWGKRTGSGKEILAKKCKNLVKVVFNLCRNSIHFFFIIYTLLFFVSCVANTWVPNSAADTSFVCFLGREMSGFSVSWAIVRIQLRNLPGQRPQKITLILRVLSLLASKCHLCSLGKGPWAWGRQRGRRRAASVAAWQKQKEEIAFKASIVNLNRIVDKNYVIVSSFPRCSTTITKLFWLSSSI